MAQGISPGAAEATVREEARTALFVAAPEPWAVLQAAAPGAAVLRPGSMELEVLERTTARAPAAARVVGIGGGTALDTAKFIAWKRRAPLILIPSILSVDAAFTGTVGVRVGGHVRYVGDVIPERIIVDPDLIRTAPPHLNRAGIGDLLSCHTGLRDWRIAHEDGHPAGPEVPWDDAAADVGATVLKNVWRYAADMGAVNDRGIAVLAEGFRRIGDACRRYGHARFEEGSEHFFAYALEAHTRRTYIHGELVAFATLALAVVQKNAPERVAQAIAESRVQAGPSHLGITEDLFVEILAGLREYARAHGHWWSIVDHAPVKQKSAREVWHHVRELLAGAGALDGEE